MAKNNSGLSVEDIAKIKESYENASDSTTPVMDKAQEARATRYQLKSDQPLNFDR